MRRQVLSALVMGTIFAWSRAGMAPARAAADSDVQQLGGLLLELEQSTRYSAQSDGWRDARDGWGTKVQQATAISQLAPLVLQFETSVGWDAMSESWRTRRDGWSAEVRAAADVPALADLLKELEDNVSWEAQTEEWRARRDGWIREASALIEVGEGEDATPIRTGETGQAPPAATEFGGLLAELERNIRYAAQSDAWRPLREEWIRQVLEARDAAELGGLLIKFETSIRWGAMDGAWRQLRDPWTEQVRGARSLAELARLMKQLEEEINWQAQEEEWRQAREAWMDSLAAVVTMGGSTPPGGSTRPAPDSTEAGPATPPTAATEDSVPVDEAIDPGRITISEPTDGWATTDAIITVSGTVENREVSIVNLDVNGSPRAVTVANGAFTSQVPLIPGENVIQARYGRTTSNSVTVTAKIAVAAIWTELTWNGQGDVDLHLYMPGEEHCYYDNRQTPSGAVLDVDNTSGYGPEHITMESGIAGDYRLAVLYFDGSGNALTWRVTLRLGDGQPQTFTGSLTALKEEQTVTTFTLGEAPPGGGPAGGVTSAEFAGWDPNRIHEVSPSHDAAGDAVPSGKYCVYVARKIPNKGWTQWRWMRYGPFDLRGRVRYDVTQSGVLRERAQDVDEGSSAFWFRNGDSRDWYAFYVHRVEGPRGPIDFDDLEALREISPGRESGGADILGAGSYLVHIAVRIPNRPYEQLNWTTHGPFALRGGKRYLITNGGNLQPAEGECGPNETGLSFRNDDPRGVILFAVKRVGP